MPKSPRLARCLLAALVAALVAAPPGIAAATATPAAERMVQVRRGDTLAGLLGAAGIPAAQAQSAIAALAPHFPPRRLAIGQEIGLRLDPGDDNALLRLEIALAPGDTLVLEPAGDGWQVERQRLEGRPHLARIEASIDGGVFPSLTRAGLPAPLVHELIRALSHEVDFQRDIQPGDHIAVAFERLRAADGALLGHGRIRAVVLHLSGRPVELWHHEDEDGEAAWYHPDGRPLAGGFLRTPLDGARVSSGFGMRRHPVLGFSRHHAGVDFAAPAGTPVFAAADGVVAAARMERGYGRTVRLRHAGGTETVYAHLSRITAGIAPGERVRQGDVIGQVGSSGMATGPHLHFEIRLAGRAADPARVALPAGERLRGEALAGFHAARRDLARQLARITAERTEVALAP